MCSSDLKKLFHIVLHILMISLISSVKFCVLIFLYIILKYTLLHYMRQYYSYCYLCQTIKFDIVWKDSKLYDNVLYLFFFLCISLQDDLPSSCQKVLKSIFYHISSSREITNLFPCYYLTRTGCTYWEKDCSWWEDWEGAGADRCYSGEDCHSQCATRTSEH